MPIRLNKAFPTSKICKTSLVVTGLFSLWIYVIMNTNCCFRIHNCELWAITFLPSCCLQAFTPFLKKNPRENFVRLKVSSTITKFFLQTDVRPFVENTFFLFGRTAAYIHTYIYIGQQACMADQNIVLHQTTSLHYHRTTVSRRTPRRNANRPTMSCTNFKNHSLHFAMSLQSSRGL